MLVTLDKDKTNKIFLIKELAAFQMFSFNYVPKLISLSFIIKI